MEFKNKQITEIYHKVKGQILLATLFEVRGLLDYEIRDRKVQGNMDQEFAVGRTIKMARTYGLKYLEYYMDQFSKAIHRNGKFEINIYLKDDHVSLRILQEADLALDFANLDRRVKELEDKRTPSNINNIMIKPSETNGKIAISNFISLKHDIFRRNIRNNPPYRQYLENLEKYERQSLSAQEAKKFRELYKLINMVFKNEISNDTLLNEYYHIYSISANEDKQVNPKITIKELTNLKEKLKDEGLLKTKPYSIYASLIGRLKANDVSSDHYREAVRLFKQINTKFSNEKSDNVTLVDLSKFEVLAKSIREKKPKISIDEQRFLSLLGTYKAQGGDSSLNKMSKLYEQIKVDFYQENEEFRQLVPFLSGNELKKPNTHEHNYLSALVKYEQEPTKGRFTNLERLSRILQKKIKLDESNGKYDELVSHFKKTGVSRTGKENQFMSLYGSYKINPRPETKSKLDKMYDQFTGSIYSYMSEEEYNLYQSLNEIFQKQGRQNLNDEQKKFVTTFKNYNKEPNQARADSLKRIASIYRTEIKARESATLSQS